MSDPLNQHPSDSPPPVATVWPPAPASTFSGPIQGPGAGDIREFEPQNELLLFLFLIITLGLYAPFWMLRTAKVVNRLVPDRQVALGAVWALLVLCVLDYLLGFGMGLFQAVTHTTLPASGTGLFGWIVTFYYWFLIFRFRGALNDVLDRTSPNLRKFSWLGTFFFGALYLQIRLNQRIKERVAEVQNMR